MTLGASLDPSERMSTGAETWELERRQAMSEKRGIVFV